MRRHTGFTLIELMVTLAIIAILAAIALPNYTAYVIRSKIAEATTNLLALKTKMEQFYQDNRTYTGACAAGTVAPLPPTTLAGGNPGQLNYFDITCTIPTPPPSNYTITATGKGDLNGMVLTINQANVRQTVSVPAGWKLPTGNCWASRKSGDC